METRCGDEIYPIDAALRETVVDLRPLPLHPGQIDVWTQNLASMSSDDWLACERLLPLAERDRYERFRVESARRQYLAARGLVRMALSRYRLVAPKSWRFDSNEYGRPFIRDALADDLHFNLTHTDGFVACAVATSYSIGIDVERLDREVDHLGLAPTVFASTEVAQVEAVTDATMRNRMFFRLWTLKEAYIKARGMGLSIPLKDFSFRFQRDEPRISFSAAIEDEPTAWRFWEFDVAPIFRMAVGARVPSAQTDLVLQPSVSIARQVAELEGRPS